MWNSDIDGLDLFTELQVPKKVLRIEINNPIAILTYIKKLNSLPNACIAYQILLTIPLTVTSAERSSSKLKLLNSYLRLA